MARLSRWWSARSGSTTSLTFWHCCTLLGKQLACDSSMRSGDGTEPHWDGRPRFGRAEAGRGKSCASPHPVGDDGHFQACLTAQHYVHPFERKGVVDYDLMFAAELTNALGLEVRPMRQRAGRLVAELGDRLQPVTVRLRRFQPPVQRVTVPSCGPYVVGGLARPHIHGRADWWFPCSGVLAA